MSTRQRLAGVVAARAAAASGVSPACVDTCADAEVQSRRRFAIVVHPLDSFQNASGVYMNVVFLREALLAVGGSVDLLNADLDVHAVQPDWGGLGIPLLPQIEALVPRAEHRVAFVEDVKRGLPKAQVLELARRRMERVSAVATTEPSGSSAPPPAAAARGDEDEAAVAGHQPAAVCAGRRRSAAPRHRARGSTPAITHLELPTPARAYDAVFLASQLESAPRLLGYYTVYMASTHLFLSHAAELVARTPQRTHDHAGLLEARIRDVAHAAWTIPSVEGANAACIRAVARDTALMPVPHLWSPSLLLRGVSVTPAADRGGGGVHIVIAEPGINVCKTPLVPLLIALGAAQAAARGGVDAPSVRGVHVLGMLPSRAEHPRAWAMVDVLSARFKAVGVPLALYPRVLMGAALTALEAKAAEDDAAVVMVAHQTLCGLNYAYYDALHAGAALVHNSPYLGGHGYAYDEDDIDGGIAAVARAARNHTAEAAAAARAWIADACGWIRGSGGRALLDAAVRRTLEAADVLRVVHKAAAHSGDAPRTRPVMSDGLVA